MRITCEECKAVYLIAEKIIGSKGRIVKCAKCSHSWFVKSLSTSQDSDRICHFSNFCNNYLKYLIIFLIVLNIFSISLFFSEHLFQYKIFENIYEKFSIYNHKDIILEDFKLRKDNNNIIISGRLINTSDKDKAFPCIRYTILDSDKKELINLTIPSSKAMIPANNALPINTKISNIQDNATYLQIDIGNKLDLLLR